MEERGVVVVGGKGTRKTDIFQSHLSAACYGVAAVRYRSKCKVPIFLLFLSSETDLACNTQYIDISTVKFQTRVGELLRKQRTGTRRGGNQADQCWRGCMPRHALLLVENVPRIMALPASFPNLIAGESRR